MNADPVVMEHFLRPLERSESDAFVDRIEEAFAIWGFGLWALEERSTGAFLGFTGLWPVGFQAHFTPAIEVGWRMATPAWGRGLATEAGRAALKFGFERAGLDEIVSFTVPANSRSVAVMERLGMSHDPADDFDHPALPESSPLRRHVLYRLTAQDWAEAQES